MCQATISNGIDFAELLIPSPPMYILVIQLQVDDIMCNIWQVQFSN